MIPIVTNLVPTPRSTIVLAGDMTAGGSARSGRARPGAAVARSFPRGGLASLTTAVVVMSVLAGCSSAASPSPSGTASLAATSPPPSLPAGGPSAVPSTAHPSTAPSTSSPGVAETLQRGTWRIVSATGISDVDRLSPVEFRDALLVGTGVCGFASDIAFPRPGEIDVKEVYWDAVICKDDDPADSRNALKAVLEAVTGGRVNGDGSVVLSGPAGEVVLSRRP